MQRIYAMFTLISGYSFPVFTTQEVVIQGSHTNVLSLE